jgi:hypothetical protein
MYELNPGPPKDELIKEAELVEYQFKGCFSRIGLIQWVNIHAIPAHWTAHWLSVPKLADNAHEYRNRKTRK